MDKPVYPCDSCTYSETFACKRCARWRQWYFYRQSLINEYAKKHDRYWFYDLPLHRATKYD